MASSGKQADDLNWWQDLLVAVAVLTLATGLFYFEVTFLGKTFLPFGTAGVIPPVESAPASHAVPRDDYRLDPGASAWGTAPWSRVVAADYAAGQLPLWDPHQGFGVPLLANAQSGGFDVLRLPVLISQSAFAWDAYYLIRTVLGGLGAYLYARTVGLVRPARFFLAIAYVFSGHFVLLGNNPWIEAYFLLPAILLGTESILAGRRRVGFAITTIAVCLSLLVGMPEVSLFVGVGGASYGAYRLLFPVHGRFTRHQLLLGAAAVIGAWIVGVALAAPMIVPLLEYAANATLNRAARLAPAMSHANLSDIYLWVVPYLDGRPIQASNHMLVSSYVGVTVIGLGLYGLYPSRTPVYKRVVPFAVVLAMLLLAKTYGAPGIDALGRLPAFDLTLTQKWSAPVTAFCLALLASVGVHRLVTERSHLVVASGAIVLVVGLVSILVLVNRPFIEQDYRTQSYQSLGLAAAFLMALWVLMVVRGVFPSTVVGLACCALIWTELFVLAPHGIYAERSDPFPQLPYVRFVESLPASKPFRVFATDALLYPNVASAYGLDDIRSLDALYPDRYLLYVENFLAPGVKDRYVGSPVGSSEQETRLEGNPWFDLTGARYVITTNGSAQAPRNNAPGGALSMPGTSPPGVASPGVAPQYAMIYHAEVQIYENRHALSRAFLVGRIRSAPDATAAIAMMSGKPIPAPPQTGRPREMTDPDRLWVIEFVNAHRHPPSDQDWADRQWSLEFAALNGHAPTDSDWSAHAMVELTLDPARMAVVEGASPALVGSLDGLGGSAQVRRADGTAVVVDVNAPGPSLLVLTDTYYPGWNASVDGESVPIYPTDLAFQGVFVPGGRHAVVFTYQPLSFKVGELIAAIGLLFFLLAMLPTYRLLGLPRKSAYQKSTNAGEPNHALRP